MTSRLTKLVVAAALASTVPAAALAHDGDRDCDGDDRPPVAYLGPPVQAFPPAPAYAPAPEWTAPIPARHYPYGAWREDRIREVRERIADLDARRAELYARFGYGPRTWRFERWYGWRRAALEHRLHELEAVAWR